MQAAVDDSKKPYELILEKIIDNPTVSIAAYEYLGEPFALSDARIYITSPENSGEIELSCLDSAGETICSCILPAKEAANDTRISVKNHHGFWDISYEVKQEGLNEVPLISIFGEDIDSTHKAIARIEVKAKSDSQAFSIGTKIRIWGV